MSRLIPFLLVVVALLLASTVFSHGTEVSTADISLDERLGQYLPADTMFTDEYGIKADLEKWIDKPTIIAPVYLTCMHECPLLLTGLAKVLGKLDLVKPGKDFQVIALSFDDNDTPKIAAEKKGNYLKAIGRPFPPESWKFLTGDAANIKKFTDSIGFKFQRDGEHEFSHPITLVIVTPGGKIVRYLYGTNFLPFDLAMALTEAAEGRVGSPARTAIMYCFSYDPLKKSYVFNILKVTGSAMVLFAASFFVYLIISTKKRGGTA